MNSKMDYRCIIQKQGGFITFRAQYLLLAELNHKSFDVDSINSAKFCKQKLTCFAGLHRRQKLELTQGYDEEFLFSMEV